jgi:hypothetical protein
MDVYAFSALGFGLGLMALASSIVIARTGVLWRWLAILGVIVGIALAVSPCYIIDGANDEGFFGVVGFIGFLGILIWVLIVSIGMIMKQVLTAQPIPQDPRMPVP